MWRRARLPASWVPTARARPRSSTALRASMCPTTATSCPRAGRLCDAAAVAGPRGQVRRVRGVPHVTVLLVEPPASPVTSGSDRAGAIDFGPEIAEAAPAAVQTNPDVIPA